jgi:AcrR family transcriptional regulator
MVSPFSEHLVHRYCHGHRVAQISATIAYTEMPKRRYELKKRAAGVEQTRRRITEATIDLHRTVGPAATQISEIARRAGVQRLTVYNHFPDEAALLGACSEHWRALHPAPDPAEWGAVADPVERVRMALRELYAWYRETEPMTANVLRDAERMPALRTIIDNGLGRYLEAVRALLVQPYRARGTRRRRLEAAVDAATGFHLWQALAPLGDDEAARLAAALVDRAAAVSGSRTGRG